MRNFLIIILITVLGVCKSDAQYLEYGAGAGLSVYWGDLNTPDFGTNLGNANFAVQGMAKLNLAGIWL